MLWTDYSAGKQTAAQLAAQHGCSCKTIYRHLRRARIRETFPQPAKANIIMDTTYFGRSFGVMVLMDSISGQVLSVREVKHETNALYAEALNDLREKGIAIQSIVCDGRKGLLQLFPEIPAQLCQFHQVKTVSRYLTRNPKTAAGKALWQLALTLKDSGKVAFQSALQAWFERHQGFLNERTVNEENGRSHYTHKQLRSAYLSLKRNLDYLFTFEAYPGLGIHNTTNLLDGKFADLKRSGVSSRDEKGE